jgi:hypothetical protein
MSVPVTTIPVMSYGLGMYLVDLDEVHGVIGSQNVKLRRMIGGRFKAAFAAADKWFDEEIADGAPSRYEALRAVIDGGPFDDHYAFQYGYAYRMICEFLGRPLFNNCFSPFHSGWLERVDQGLDELGIKAVSVSDFSYNLQLPPLPCPDELPGYGEWSPKECREALTQWEASTPAQREAIDGGVLEAIESCVAWMRQAQTEDGMGIVGFFS